LFIYKLSTRTWK